jgi:hypothetical protein
MNIREEGKKLYVVETAMPELMTVFLGTLDFFGTPRRCALLGVRARGALGHIAERVDPVAAPDPRAAPPWRPHRAMPGPRSAW